MQTDLIRRAEAKRAEAVARAEAAKAALAIAEQETAEWDGFLRRAAQLESETAEPNDQDDQGNYDETRTVAGAHDETRSNQKPRVREGTLIEKMVKTMRYGTETTAADLADLLVRNGKVVEGENLSIVVRNTLKRRSDLFTEGKTAGSWTLVTEDYELTSTK